MLEFEGLAVIHRHVVLEVGIVRDVRLGQYQVLLLPLTPESAPALLVQEAFFDGYGATRTVGLGLGSSSVDSCFCWIVCALALQ